MQSTCVCTLTRYIKFKEHSHNNVTLSFFFLVVSSRSAHKVIYVSVYLFGELSEALSYCVSGGIASSTSHVSLATETLCLQPYTIKIQKRIVYRLGPLLCLARFVASQGCNLLFSPRSANRLSPSSPGNSPCPRDLVVETSIILATIHCHG